MLMVTDTNECRVLIATMPVIIITESNIFVIHQFVKPSIGFCGQIHTSIKVFYILVCYFHTHLGLTVVLLLLGLSFVVCFGDVSRGCQYCASKMNV